MAMEINTLDEAAAAMHEMYVSYLRAGFSKTQAFQLVLKWAEIAYTQSNGEPKK